MNSLKGFKVISKVKRRRSYKRILLVILAVAMLQFIAVEALLIANGKSDEEKRTDFLIVLGAAINGETPSLALQLRLVTAVEYLKKYPDTHVVVSGGQGRGEDITEAEAMRRFLVAGGIDESRILMESRSTSTMENFKYSKQLIEQTTGKTVTDITFITNSFHIMRARLLAGRNGLEASAVSCKTPGQVIVQMYLREYLALFKSLLVDR